MKAIARHALAALAGRDHFERMQHDRLRRSEPLDQPVGPVGVHQKPDAAEMHAVNRKAGG